MRPVDAPPSGAHQTHRKRERLDEDDVVLPGRKRRQPLSMRVGGAFLLLILPLATHLATHLGGAGLFVVVGRHHASQHSIQGRRCNPDRSGFADLPLDQLAPVAHTVDGGDRHPQGLSRLVHSIYKLRRRGRRMLLGCVCHYCSLLSVVARAARLRTSHSMLVFERPFTTSSGRIAALQCGQHGAIFLLRHASSMRLAARLMTVCAASSRSF
ncbi:hypothetical protein G6F22_018341 [Rhizopus arrhizus]|nr:hypothetical protein G6F22_018341 [Rhizopus arrhizus]